MSEAGETAAALLQGAREVESAISQNQLADQEITSVKVGLNSAHRSVQDTQRRMLSSIGALRRGVQLVSATGAGTANAPVIQALANLNQVEEILVDDARRLEQLKQDIEQKMIELNTVTSNLSDQVQVIRGAVQTFRAYGQIL